MIAGKVLTLNGRPLADVTLAIDAARRGAIARGASCCCCRASRQAGINSRSRARGSAGRPYGFFEAGLTIGAGRTTVLSYTIWMSPLDTPPRSAFRRRRRARRS